MNYLRMSKPINAGEPIKTAIATIIPRAIPTIMNLLFTSFIHAA